MKSFRLSVAALLVGLSAGVSSTALAQSVDITFDQEEDEEYSDSLSGPGTVTKLNTNTLTLSGDSSGFEGTTSIVAGKIVLTGKLGGTLSYVNGTTLDVGQAGDLRANLTGPANNSTGAIVFSKSGEYNYSGDITGSGYFYKSGEGTLELSGILGFGNNTRLYAQNGGRIDLTGVSGGTAGSIVQIREGLVTLNTELNKRIVVYNGGILGGTGKVTSANVGQSAIDIQSGGRLSPGNPETGQGIGTLRAIAFVRESDGLVGPALNLAAGSTYQVDINADGQSDRIETTGGLSLNGNLDVRAHSGEYSSGSHYLIAYTTGTLSSSIANITIDDPSLRPVLTFTGKGAILSLVDADATINTSAQTTNQRAVVAAIEAQPISQLNDYLLIQSAGAARDSLDQLSGEVHASSLSVLALQNEDLRRTAWQRLDAPVATDSLVIWAGAAGYTRGINASGGTDKVDIGGSTGLRFGVDANWRGVRLGAVVGHTTSDLELAARRSQAEVASKQAAIYAAGSIGALQLRGGVSHSRATVKISRDLSIVAFTKAFTLSDGSTVTFSPALTDNVLARYGGSATEVFGEAGYGIPLGFGTIEPFAGVHRLRLKSDAFQEDGIAGITSSNGVNLRLAGASQTRQFTWGTLGLKGRVSLSETITFNLKGGWQRRLSGDEIASDLSFQRTGEGFTVAGAPLPENAGAVDTALNWQLSRSISLSAGYSGTFAEVGGQHAVRFFAGFRF